jgi:hypothetical protein
MTKGPSVNLSWKELACKDGTPYPSEFIRDRRVYTLAAVFEAIRRLCGDKPITITSAFRTIEWNRKIGGAYHSQHVQGRALDLIPPRGFTVQGFYDLIRANHRELGVTGIGKYRTFVHVDIRSTPSGRLVVWRGNGIKDSGSIA